MLPIVKSKLNLLRKRKRKRESKSAPRVLDLRNIFAAQEPKWRRKVLARQDTKRYAVMCLDQNCHPAVKKIRKTRHFLKWAIKLIVPNFLIGHPNLWDNLKTLRKNPQFKPLRMAFVAWLIFTLTVGSTGIYSLITAPNAQASDDFSIKTGYYYGNGTSLSVSGLGFTPEVIIIKSDAATNLVWKSSAMPAAVTAYLGIASADNTETEITLGADGFTVSQALEVNTVSVRYTYIAFAGSDCSSGGVMCVGLYTGNGTASRAITTGFQPDLVWTKRTTALAGNFRTSAMSNNNASWFSATANDTTGVYFKTLDEGGSFTVGLTNNTNGGVYYYVAFKNLASKLTVGQFTGDGVDNKNITGLGFEPDFVFVKQNSTNGPIFNTTEDWGDLSSYVLATANAVNHIQSLDADGFQVGTSVNVNALGVVSFYFAFGGVADPAPAGSFFMQRGSYTGTGVAQNIETSFAPDLVFIKGNATEYAVWSMRLDTDITHYFSVSAVGFANGITTMNGTSFTVGTSNTVNANGITYEWIAFGNVTSPHTGARAADVAIGYYTGNGLSPRAIDHLGLDPDMVVIKRPITTAALSIWGSSNMAANTSAYFSAAANVTDGTTIRSFDSSGFSVGTGATANAVNVTYAWFAFKEGTFFDVGSYAGNSAVDREITGVGFASDFLWTKRDTAVAAVHKSSDSGIAGNDSQHFMNLANDTNDIKTFTSDGFTLGNSAEVNTTGGTYQYAAWDSSTSSNPPSTPTNSSPSGGATAQDLNTTLTGSAYSDPDSNAQTDAQWQVDDDSDFATPVWTRTSSGAEITTSITAGNGTFANELSGETELDHNSTYYWRVRYSDSVWSTWSTATSFTTNIISTPTHSSPADEATVTTLTPTLTASAFSDAQTGHTASFAQWQISANSSFSSTVYDSGAISYSSSHTVSSATLSDRSVYYWRVRYQDSSEQWSSYSTATRFLVSNNAEISVMPLFGGTVVDQGDAVKIDAQVKLSNGTAVNDAVSTINIYNPSGTKIVDGATLDYLSGSSGIYRYSYTIPSTNGSYLYEVTAATSSWTGYGAANFEVRTIAADTSSTKSTVEAEQTAQSAERTSQAAERTTQAAERAVQSAERILQEASRVKVEDVQTKVTDVQTKVTNIQSNIDILIGAMIVTQSTVNDTSASTISFITSLTNSTNDFYKNAVLTFTSGALDGQSRRVSGYNGSTKIITLDPALTSAPANGDAFTIVAQNVRVEEQVTDHETAQATERVAQASFRTDTTSRLTSIESKIDTITTNLNTVDTNLDSVLSTVNSIRTSQQKNFKVTLSDVSEIQAGNTYRAKLTVLDFESNPVDTNTTPTIEIYDATRAVAQSTTSMTKLSTGVYEYTSAVADDATAGLWETIVNVDVAGTADVIRNDYWQVTGAPAQVVINSMSDLTVPSISANTTITNEGNGAFEYQYEWCVVSSQDNQCGGNDDVYYASAAKLIATGDSFNSTLTATVPSVDDYWFKVVVYYGTEASGASRTFTATTSTPETTPSPSGGGGGGSLLATTFTATTSTPETTPSPSGGGGSLLATTKNIYSEIIKARNQLESQSQKLTTTLEILDAVSPHLQELLQVNNLNTENLIDVQNKVADLRAFSAATRRIVEQKTVEPIVETYMKFNSVEINFLITNPDLNQQVVKFKAFLPEEAKPEHILDLSGLKVDYDTNAKVYYVSGDITLGPKETVTRKVEMKDIWVFAPEEIKSIKDQANGLIPTLAKTQYEAQGAILKNDIVSTLNIVLLRQEESYASPQDHIVLYRENKERMVRAENNLEKIKDLVVQAGASRGVVGQVGGIQTFATWGIILAIVFGFGLLAAMIFAMWRHQTMLAAVAIGMNRNEAMAQFGGVIQKRRKLLEERQVAKTRSQSAQKLFIWNLPWKKILIWFSVFAIALILVIVSVKFAPMIFSLRGIQFENKEIQTVPQEKAIGSKLIPETQENANAFFGGGENDKNISENTKPSIQKLKITDTPTGWLNVRDSASLDGKMIAKVYPGDDYEYTDEINGWYKITLKNKTAGWIFGSYIEKIQN